MALLDSGRGQLFVPFFQRIPIAAGWIEFIGDMLRGALPVDLMEEVELQPCCDYSNSNDDGILVAEKEAEESSPATATALDTATRAAVGVGARVLLYPSLAYNLARNHLSPSRFHWWDRVDSTNILLGAVPFPSDVPRLRDLGVRAVVTLTKSYERLVPAALYADHGIDNLVLPTTDYLYAPSPEDLRRAVEFIHGNAERGRLTYVHCKAGRARSATVVMCYLVRYKGMTPDRAYNHVRSSRPRVSLAPTQWQAVKDFYRLNLARVK